MLKKKIVDSILSSIYAVLRVHKSFNGGSVDVQKPKSKPIHGCSPDGWRTELLLRSECTYSVSIVFNF